MNPPNSNGSMSRFRGWLQDDRVLLALQCLAMFLFVLGARLWLIGKYGTDLPFWDQWSEGYGLFKNISNGTVTIQDWLAPNSEHRILLTRLFSYGFFAINGQWDSRVLMVANAAFFSAFGCLLFLLFAKEEKRPFRLLASIILALVFACPFGWQNALWGFQTHFYFLIAFSLATIWLMINKPAWSPGWWFGVLCGIGTLFTLASGLLASLAVLCFTFVVLVRDWQNRREALQRLWPSAVISIAIIALGELLFAKVDGHNGYRAHSIAQFANALSCYLSWPWLPSGWPWNFAEALQPESLTWPWFYKEWCWFWAIVSWLPAGILLYRYFFRRLSDGPRERFLIAATTWMFLTILATAFFRARGSSPPRYFDLLSMGVIFNAVAAWILIRALPGSKKKIGLSALLVAWLGLNGLGMYRLGFVEMIGASTGISIMDRGFLHNVQKLKVSGFIATNDQQILTPQKSRFEIPYTGKESLVEFLSDPFILRILPVSVREPLRVSNPETPAYGAELHYQIGTSAPYPWEKLWPLPTPGNSDYSVTKTEGLPYLHMFVRGDIDKLKILDANAKPHDLVQLSQGPNGWYEVYASCPTKRCAIRAANPAQNPAVFSEPKEVGRLSLVAILMTNNWWLFCVPGGVIFLFCIIMCLLGKHNERPSVRDADILRSGSMGDKAEILRDEYRMRFAGTERYRNNVWMILCQEYFKRFVSPEAAVLDLGCGWGEFINNIEASKKYAMDLNSDAGLRLAEDTVFLHQDCSQEWTIKSESLDVVFTSNFLEHLPDKGCIERAIAEAYRCLKPGGLIICIGPNIKYVRGAYWDFWDHIIPLTDQSLSELLKLKGFNIELRIPRFLPYTMSTGSTPPLFLLRLFLKLPRLLPLFGKQFLVVGRKKGPL